MVLFDELFNLYQPWLALIGIVFTFIQLYLWAKNKKTGAIIFAVFMQMMLPDPHVERIIKVVQVEKETIKEQKDDDSDLNH